MSVWVIGAGLALFLIFGCLLWLVLADIRSECEARAAVMASLFEWLDRRLRAELPDGATKSPAEPSEEADQ